MLSPEDNALLTQVGQGTPMGGALREYWIPALLATEVAEPGGKPIRLRLLGEDLVAFRNTEGRVGILGEHCPHRGASLYFGRNEDCRIRCVYHGWQFDLDGNCTDMPNEPETSTFKDRIHQTAYRCVERGQMVWVYMGSRSEPPPPPMLEWSLLGPEHSYISKRVQSSNWAQVLEGGIDASHGSFLHMGINDGHAAEKLQRGVEYLGRDTRPKYEVFDTDYGSVMGARRSIDDEHYWRIYQFLMPFYTMIPPYGDRAIGGHAFVPRDDGTTIVWSATWHPVRELDQQIDFRGADSGTKGIHVTAYKPTSPEADGAWMPLADRANDYFMDYEKQQTKAFSGVPGIPMQDAAVQESMGPVYDRTQEHLASADLAIIHARRKWLRLAKAVPDDGTLPALPGVEAPDSYMVRSASVMLPQGVNWLEEAAAWLTAEPGAFLESV
jgi:phthalate 4,5-dioxygenase oxygenase subunit